MNREIKFRQPIYLNGKFNTFHYWGHLSKGSFVAPANNFVNDGIGDQFTGLKDANDVEIYEGDIVNIYTKNGIDKTIVSYHGVGFYFQDVDNEANIRPLDHYKREVIGNICENPELLNQDGS